MAVRRLLAGVDKQLEEEQKVRIQLIFSTRFSNHQTIDAQSSVNASYGAEAVRLDGRKPLVRARYLRLLWLEFGNGSPTTSDHRYLVL